MALRVNGHRVEYPQEIVDAMPAGLRLAFERSPALDHDSRTRRPREPGHERDRRGEDERTWGRYDDDRERSLRVAAHCPGQARDQQGGRKEEPRIAVGHPHQRGPLGLRLLD